jgi:hypothetical protein
MMTPPRIELANLGIRDSLILMGMALAAPVSTVDSQV